MPLSKNEFKDIKSLAGKKGRKAQQSFLAEGVRVLEEAVRHQVRPDLVLWAPAGETERVQRLIKSFQRSGVPCEEISARQLQSITEAKQAQPIVGRFPADLSEISQLLDGNARKVLICDGISDPGNVGTLIRSGLAFGFDQIILTGDSADPFSPKVVRSSAGAIFGVRVAKGTADELRECLKESAYKLIGSVLTIKDESLRLDQELIKERLILAIGSEATGLSDEITLLCDDFVRVKHSAQVESLNAAIAGSILMQMIYELEP